MPPKIKSFQKDNPSGFAYRDIGCLLIIVVSLILFFIFNPEFFICILFIIAVLFLSYRVSKWMDKREMAMLKEVFSAENIYQEALSRGKEDLLVKLVFYELFVTHCVEVKELQDEGLLQYFYKIAPTVDISLFNEVEQMIVSEMLVFTPLEKVIEKATKQLKRLEKDKMTKILSAMNITSPTQKNIDERIDNYQNILMTATSIYHQGCF